MAIPFSDTNNPIDAVKDLIGGSPYDQFNDDDIRVFITYSTYAPGGANNHNYKLMDLIGALGNATSMLYRKNDGSSWRIVKFDMGYILFNSLYFIKDITDVTTAVRDLLHIYHVLTANNRGEEPLDSDIDYLKERLEEAFYSSDPRKDRSNMLEELARCQNLLQVRFIFYLEPYQGPINHERRELWNFDEINDYLIEGHDNINEEEFVDRLNRYDNMDFYNERVENLFEGYQYERLLNELNNNLDNFNQEVAQQDRDRELVRKGFGILRDFNRLKQDVRRSHINSRRWPY